MKKLAILILSVLALAGCRTQKQYTEIPVEREVVKVQKVTEVEWDTIYLNVPAQTAEVITIDSISHLETDFAVSDARINPDGTLFHSLKNKPQGHPQIVPTTIIHNDSIVEREVPVPIYIDKPPNTWQRIKINSFWWLLGGLLAALAIIFRKQIVSVVKNFILN